MAPLGWTPQGILQREVAKSYTAVIKAGMKASRERILEYQKWYAGQYDVKLPAKLVLELQDLGLKSNFAVPVVDAMCGKLNLKSISSLDPVTQKFLDAEYRHNEIDQQSTAIATEIAICGDAYGLVWPEYDDLNAQPTGHAQIRLLQTEDVALKYSERDLLKPVECVRTWIETDGAGEPLVRRDTLTDFEVYREFASKGTLDMWEEYTGDGLPALILNPMRVIPIVHFRMKFDPNNRPFGVSQLEAAIAPMKDINGLIKDGMMRAYYNSGQQTVITGVDWIQFLKNNPAGLDRSPTATHVWQSSGAKEYTLQGDQLTPFIEMKNNRIADLATSTSTPMHYLDPKSQVLSGVALQEIDIAMKDKVEVAETLMGNAYIHMFWLAARAVGKTIKDVAITWEKPFRADTTQNDILTVKADLMSRESFLAKQGMTKAEITAELALIDNRAKELIARDLKMKADEAAVTAKANAAAQAQAALQAAQAPIVP
jgi:hypothetical protein